MNGSAGATEVQQADAMSGPPAAPLRDALVFLTGAAALSQVLPRVLFAMQPPFLVAAALILLLVAMWTAWMIGYPMWVARQRRLPLHGTIDRGERGSRWVDISIGVGVALVVLAVNTVLTIVFETELSATPGQFDYEITAGHFTFALIVASIFATTIGPVAEELSFRWLVYGAFRAKLGVPIALLLQAIIFAGLHSYELLYLVFVFFGGLALGAVYEWRRSLSSVVAMHIAHNVVVIMFVVILVLMTQSELRNTPMLGVGMEQADDGVRITHVLPASAADAAGLLPGDVINGIGDYGVQTVDHMTSAVRFYEVGDTVVIYFLREDEQMTTEAILRGWR